jgi:hypothetical protein
MADRPGKPVETCFDDLEQALDSAREDGVTDESLAYALIAVGAGFSFDEDLDKYSDLIMRMAWMVHVRAPALNLKWLVDGALALDRVYWGTLPLSRLVNNLRSLEESAHAEHGDVESWLASPVDDPDVVPIREAATRVGQIASASGTSLCDQVHKDIAEVKHCVVRGDLLALVIEPRARA